MKRQRNIPQLRFPEFKGEWDKRIINETCNIVGGGTPDSGTEEFWNGNIQWFTPTEIKSDYVSSSERTITELGLKKSSARLLPKGTILLTSRATIGEVAIALNECTTNQGFQSLIVNKEYDNLFIFNWIKNNKYQFIRRANGSTFLEISKSEIGTIPIFVPTLPEQQKIASFFTAIDQKISQLKRKKTLLEQYKKGVMQKIFSQEIRFKDDNGQEFPKWEKKRLGELYDITSSKRVFQSEWTKEGVPFYRAREIVVLSELGFVDNELFISTEMYNKYKSKYGVPQKYDLLVTGVGTIGVLYVVKENERFYFKDGNIIWFKSSNKVNSQFVKYLFQTRIIRKQIEDNASITTVGTYTIESAKKTIVPFPIIEEQTKIASFLSAIDDKINHTQKQIEKAEVWKKGLMQQMFV